MLLGIEQRAQSRTGSTTFADVSVADDVRADEAELSPVPS
jgi:hypothetical protein